MTEQSDESAPNACPCGHSVWWHHESRGCGYHGYAPEHRCPCRLMAHEAVEAVVRAARAQAYEDAADLLRDFRETFPEEQRASILSGETAIRMVARLLRTPPGER